MFYNLIWTKRRFLHSFLHLASHQPWPGIIYSYTLNSNLITREHLCHLIVDARWKPLWRVVSWSLEEGATNSHSIIQHSLLTQRLLLSSRPYNLLHWTRTHLSIFPAHWTDSQKIQIAFSEAEKSAGSTYLAREIMRKSCINSPLTAMRAVLCVCMPCLGQRRSTCVHASIFAAGARQHHMDKLKLQLLVS